ncbi:MAG: hypothetical protein V4508_04490 [Pseudomonadota bacterium]
MLKPRSPHRTLERSPLTMRFLLVFGLINLASGFASAAGIPPVVVRFAESFAASQPEPEKISAGRTRTEDYAAWFFQGFISPVGTIATKSELMRDASTRAQFYWRDHPDARDAIFSDYGYAPVESDGVWSRGFEVSSFVPENGSAVKWSLTSFGGVRWRDLGPDHIDAPSHGARVHIIGYISPQGSYGHLGGYPREVLITSFALADSKGP